MPAGSGLRLIKSTPAAPCVITESLARCTLAGPFPQTIKLTAVGSVKGEFKNKALLTAGGVTTSDDANVTVFVPKCGKVTPGGGLFNKCPPGNEYNPSFAGRTPANSFTCCVSGCCVQACALCSLAESRPSAHLRAACACLADTTGAVQSVTCRHEAPCYLQADPISVAGRPPQIAKPFHSAPDLSHTCCCCFLLLLPADCFGSVSP
jgi:hypothetical protein